MHTADDHPPDCDCGCNDGPLQALPSILLCWAILLAVLFLCAGCTQQERTASGTVHTRRQYRETPTADGGKVVVEETWTESTDESKTTSGFDPAFTANLGGAVSAGAKVIGGVATGNYGEAAAGIAGLISIAAAAFAGHQRGKAVVERKRAEEHKADAVEGWSKATGT